MDLGICPNCLGKMTKIDYFIPQITKIKGKLIESKELTIPQRKYFCGRCDIISNNNENFNDRNYIIVNSYHQPTEKQIKTIYLINSKMHLGLRPLTKNQCSRDIDKYFKIAIDDNKPMFEDSIQIK